MSDENSCGVSSLLERKAIESIYPQIGIYSSFMIKTFHKLNLYVEGHVFANIPQKKDGVKAIQESSGGADTPKV